jgi:peroxiredoxin
MSAAVRLPLVLGALALPLTGACAHAPGPPPPSAPSPLVGKALPDFRRPTVQGPVFDTADARGRGRVLIVDFFAAYCRPCQRALPALEALHEARPDVEIVGISLDDGSEGAVTMINRHHLTFPVVHDAEHVLAGRFRVSALPTSFVVDATGRVVWTSGAAQGASESDEGSGDALPRVVTAVARNQ